jgi:hypothetical protein
MTPDAARQPCRRFTAWQIAFGLAATLFGLTGQPIIVQAQPVTAPAPARWYPAPDAKFDMQFAAPMMLQRTVDFLVLDLNDALPDEVESVRTMGAAPVCYMNAGTLDTTASDLDAFPPLDIGRPVTEEGTERWLDTRDIKGLAPAIIARLDLCKDKGFMGVLAGNLENHQYRTGFPIGERQQLEFNVWLAREAHRRGLTIGMWNSRSQIVPLASTYDFVVLSGCFTDGYCNEVQPFVEAKKGAFLIEYAEEQRTDIEFCAAAQGFGVMGIIKRRVMDGWLRLCPPPELN